MFKFPIAAMWRDPYKPARVMLLSCTESPRWCKSHIPGSQQRDPASSTSTALGKHWGRLTHTLLLSSPALDCAGLVKAPPRRTNLCCCATRARQAQNQPPENGEMKTTKYSLERTDLAGWWSFVREETSQAVLFLCYSRHGNATGDGIKGPKLRN